jgi:hypothetical protein
MIFSKFKVAAGLLPPSRIFLKILKLQLIALVGLKSPTKFQKDRSNGLKVMIFSKIQDGRWPAAAILDFLKILKLQLRALVGL